MRTTTIILGLVKSPSDLDGVVRRFREILGDQGTFTVLATSTFTVVCRIPLELLPRVRQILAAHGVKVVELEEILSGGDA